LRLICESVATNNAPIQSENEKFLLAPSAAA